MRTPSEAALSLTLLVRTAMYARAAARPGAGGLPLELARLYARLRGTRPPRSRPAREGAPTRYGCSARSHFPTSVRTMGVRTVSTWNRLPPQVGRGRCARCRARGVLPPCCGWRRRVGSRDRGDALRVRVIRPPGGAPCGEAADARLENPPRGRPVEGPAVDGGLLEGMRRRGTWVAARRFGARRRVRPPGTAVSCCPCAGCADRVHSWLRHAPRGDPACSTTLRGRPGTGWTPSPGR